MSPQNRNFALCLSVRLLLVEDSHRLRTTLAKALTRLGHAVDEAQDAEEGETLGQDP